MTFDLQAVTPIILAVLGLASGVGFWQYRISRKDAPVRKTEADMAVAEKSQQMAMAIAERLDKDYAQVRAQLSSTQAAVAAQGEQIVALQQLSKQQEATIGTLRQLVQVFSDAWDDLVHNWDRYRQQDVAPNRPSHRLDD